MTVSTTSNRINQTGDGVSTVFAFPYKFIQAADIKVYVNNALLSSGYTVGTPTDTGANITFTAAPASGATIVIISDPARTQPTSLPSTGPFPAKTVETALDKLTLLVQRLADLVGRSFTLSDGDTSAPTTTLPLVSSLKGSVLAFNATTGAPEAGPTIASVGTVAAASAAINTVAGNITNVNTVAGNNANVTNVGGSISSVNTVANNIAAVNTNATNITAIQGAAGNASAAASSASAAASSASAASGSATSAAGSATAASASATAAAAAAASGLYRQVIDKSSNYTIVAADQGTLFRASTGSGAVTFTLPSISAVTDGYKVSVVKWTSDGNVVNVSRAGSDTINGGTAVQIQSQYSQIVFVADFETNQWFASQSGLGATNNNVDVFSGNGSTTGFTLSADPGSKNNTRIHIGGVYQFKSTYSITGTALTFSSAPPSGSSNIEVEYGTPLAIGTPSDGTVTTAKLIDQSVTTAKLALNAVTQAILSADLQGATYGFKNRIINGAMMVSQRGTAFAAPANLAYTVDRWLVNWAGAAPSSVNQVAGPTGYKNALRLSGGASNTGLNTQQRIESLNCTDLSGATVTIQANISVSSAQTIGWALQYANSADNFSAVTSISSGTWSATTTATVFTATITNLPAGALNGLALVISPNNGAGLTSGTVDITGVQLEKGSTATSFDYRPYGTELALCQRYYEAIQGIANMPLAVGQAFTPNAVFIVLPFQVRKRATPTFSYTGAWITLTASGSAAGGSPSLNAATQSAVRIDISGASGLTAGNAAPLWCNTTGDLQFSAEL